MTAVYDRKPKLAAKANENQCSDDVLQGMMEKELRSLRVSTASLGEYPMLEAELRDLLASRIDVIEKGLTHLQKEKFIPNEVGTRSFIDLVAQDKDDHWVLIEIKRSDSSAREAIHEVYKYVEGVKRHLAARDDEIRVIVASTEWKELLVPFSRFVHDTSISVKGMHLTIHNSTDDIMAVEVSALDVTAGRVLSPWHEISFYRTESRLREGIESYDVSCQAKGICDYIMVILSAPEGHYERGVRATANAMAGIRGDRRASDAEVAEMFKQIPRLDHILYFVPQLFAEDLYLDAIKGDLDVYEEAKECLDGLSGEEALCALQEFALFAKPNVERDGYEIGYPAKFKSKLVDGEGWEVREVLRRGAFLRNSILTDDTILGEIAGDAGASGQRFKRTVVLSDKAALSSAKSSIKE